LEVPNGRDEGMIRGLAWVTTTNHENIMSIDGTTLHERKIQVSVALSTQSGLIGRGRGREEDRGRNSSNRGNNMSRRDTRGGNNNFTNNSNTNNNANNKPNIEQS